MAKKEESAPAPAPAAEPAKKKLPVKVIGVVAGLMVAEAAAVYMVFGAIGPKQSHAETSQQDLKPDDSNETLEIEIADEKFQNLQQGNRVWLWDTQVAVQVKKKNEEEVKKIMERRSGELKEGIGQIIAKAQPRQLQEPDRQTLNRQFSALLEKVMKSATGEKLFERVLIPKCRGFPAD